MNKSQRCGSSFAIFVIAVFLGVVSLGGLLHAQQPTPDPQQPSQTQPSPDTQTPPSQATPQSQDQTGQQAPGQTQPDPSGKQTPTDSQAQPSDPAGSQIFTGTVVKQGAKYMLQDDSGTTYDIDHQDEVKKFEGKKIRVHGTLDPNGKMIHVQ